jgi:hypothetical protein
MRREGPRTSEDNPMAIDTLTTVVPHSLRRDASGTAERIRQTLQGMYYVLYKNLAGYLIVIMCGLAMVKIHRDVEHIWPVNIYTVITLLSLIFPGTAFMYFTFNLRTRLDEIRDAARRAELYCVYFTEDDNSQAERKFFGTLLRRFSEYYNPLELAGFALAAGALAFTIQVLLAKQAGIGLEPIDSSLASTWLLLLIAGFFGALSGAFLLIVKKYRTFDIYPSTYLHAAVALVVGTVAGAALSSMVPSSYSAIFIFTVGFFTATHVSFFGELLRGWLARQAGVAIPPTIDTDLARVVRNSDAIESLTSLSLNTVGELVMAEPLVLYLNMPQPLGVINGWIDRGLLHFYLETFVQPLHDAGIERFTQLVEMITDRIEPDRIVWADGVKITGNLDIDQQVHRIVKNLVQSRLHHRLLGILWEKYRKTFFISDGTPTSPAVTVSPGLTLDPLGNAAPTR